MAAPKALGALWGAPANHPWMLRRLKDVAKVVNGYPFDSKLFDASGEHALVRIRDLNSATTETRFNGQWVEAAAIKTGDVLVGMDGDFNVGTWEGGSALLNQRMCCVRGESSLMSRFLRYVLPTPLAVTNDLTYFTTVKHLSSLDVERITLSVPPPQLLESVVNFLDEKTARIDALIAEKERLVERLRDYQYSYSSHLMTRGLHAEATMALSSFPELGSVPSHWGIKRLKFLGNVRSGVAKGKDLGERTTVSLPYLRVANVQDGYLDLAEVHEIEVPEQEVTKYLLHKGDVLMNEGGDNDKLGRGTIWQGQVDPCIHQNHVFAVRLHDTCLAEWVSRFTSTDAARAYFFLRSKQSTNLASINQENVRELPVPMPPAGERAAILAELQRSSEATVDLLEHAIAHIERLREYRASLISAAVTGQLNIDDFQARQLEAV
jgi:type I restriction enzyme S subunit